MIGHPPAESGGGPLLRRGKSAEEIATSILRKEGFEVVARNYRVELENELVAEIDIVAEKDGERYAVEVKAGTVGVDAVRQAYVAAELTGYRPLVMGRRVHPSAEALADHLGVEVREFSEFVEVEPVDELGAVVSDLLQDKMLGLLSAASNVSWEDLYVAFQGDLRRVTELVRVRDRSQAEDLVEALAFLKLMASDTVGAVKGVEGDEFLLELDPRVRVPDGTTLVVLNRWGSPAFVVAEPVSVGTHRARMRSWEGEVEAGERVVYLGEVEG
ncbi:YraN family protein [Methanopyrus sp.]